MARVKALKTLMCKSKVELALVRPGLVAVPDKVASVKLNEERLDLLKVTAVSKAKGKTKTVRVHLINFDISNRDFQK